MKKELLAPAGDFDTLKQAIHNGCDAVYLGGKRFGARKFASNFNDGEMIRAIRYCHLYGVKIYVTVNTMIFDEEVEECLNYITFLHENGVDAVIMQDMGMITLVRQVLPHLDIHVSTQAHTHNLEQIRLLEALGVTRIVVARELSLEEIEKLDTKLEIEVFIHGALCVCYSGQCLFSSMLLSRSGNRGECAGICRLPFQLLEDGKEIKTEGQYLLSPKELNTTAHIKELLKSNITSFKIEGRMKSSTTIGHITRLYRMLITHYEKGEEITLTKQEQEQLEVLFNREFTEGYLFHHSGKRLMNVKSPNHIGIEIGQVVDVNQKRIKIRLTKELNQEDGIRFQESELGMIANFIYDVNGKLVRTGNSGDIIYLDNKIGLHSTDKVRKTLDKKLLLALEQYPEKKIPVSMKLIASVDKQFTLILTDKIYQVNVKKDIVQRAEKEGTTKERILDQVLKLGDTPFIVENYEVEVEEKIFIPISKINEARRELVQNLIELRENRKGEIVIQKQKEILKQETKDFVKLTALVRNKEQLECCLEEKIDTIYVTDYHLYNEYKQRGNIYYRIPRVMNHFPDYQNEKLLIGEIGSYFHYHTSNEIVGDYFLNVSNSYHIDYLRKLNLKAITLSVENSLDTIFSIAQNVGNSGLEVIIYGRLEAMVMKYCPLKMLVNQDKKPCNICRNGKKYELKDRNNAIYPILSNQELTHIFYHSNMDKTKTLPELLDMGIRRFRFEFFDETGKEIKQVLKNAKSLIS